MADGGISFALISLCLSCSLDPFFVHKCPFFKALKTTWLLTAANKGSVDCGVGFGGVGAAGGFICHELIEGFME